MSDVLRTLMTRRSGQAYPIDDAWRRRVRDRLAAKGMSQADLARAAGCSPATISELLGGKSHESPLVPDIHTALGWSPPRMPVLSLDQEELLAYWDKLDPARRARLLERAAMLAEDVDKAPDETSKPTGKKRS